MRLETNISKAIDAIADVNARYDSNVKWLLSDKQILARILKYTMQEFANEPIEYIITCISDVEVENIYVEPGLTNVGRVRGEAMEDAIPNEGKIVYDIRFSVIHKRAKIKILINVEAQKSTDPAKLGYHLENRVIYYLARMVSAQKETEFFHSDYDNIKRVRSIWICMDAGRDEEAIEEISLYRKWIDCGDNNFADMDLIKGIIIKLRQREGVKKSKNNLISMLEDLLAQTEAEEKKENLKRYGIIMTEEIERRLCDMCNLSEAIAEEAMEKGIEKGVERECLSSIRKMLKKGYSGDEIKDVLEVSDSQLQAAMKLN